MAKYKSIRWRPPRDLLNKSSGKQALWIWERSKAQTSPFPPVPCSGNQAGARQPRHGELVAYIRNHRRTQPDAGDRQDQGGQIAPRSQAIQRHDDRADEFHGGNQAHGQALQRQIERGVHGGQAGPQAQHEQACRRIGPRHGAPGPGIRREHQRRRSNTHPCHPQDADGRKQQHRKRGSQVVELPRWRQTRHRDVRAGRHVRPGVRVQSSARSFRETSFRNYASLNGCFTWALYY